MKIRFKITFDCIADFPEIDANNKLKAKETIQSIKDDFALRLELENQIDLHQLKTLEHSLLPEITDIKIIKI